MAIRILGTEHFPEALRAVLLEKAEGVPLFIEEVVKTLLDVGALQRENGSYRVVQGLAEARVPDTVQGIIMARLDRLGEEGKRRGVELARLTHAGFLFGQAAIFIGYAYTAKGAYEDALQWYQQLSEYASKAGDAFWRARVPNIISSVHRR